jgi:cell division ATPase FtsA
MARRSKTLVGLDIGSTRVTTIVAESESGQLKAIGYGEAESRGLKKGVVVNLEATVDAIRKSVGEAELMVGGDGCRERGFAAVAFSRGQGRTLGRKPTRGRA